LAEYLTIEEVCVLLKLGKRTVYELARTGRLPGAAKVGGQWRVNRETLTAWLEAGGEFDAADGSPSEK
jgi:excisionase family DNA binding protein